MNVLLVSHCDFSGNSAMHVFSIANHLRAHGIRTVVAVPNDPKTVRTHGEPGFQLLHHDQASRDGVVFPDGRGPDLIHAWTPREHVRKLTEKLASRYRSPYLLHLEDNEEVIVADELNGFDFREFSELPVRLLDEIGSPYRTNPRRAKDFLARAAGVTAVIDKLLEFKPAELPGCVFWPGFDDSFRKVPNGIGDLRRKLGIPPDAHVLVYTGNIHKSNESEVTSLILAAGILHRKGIPIRLVKTGSNYAGQDVVAGAIEAGYLLDLGWLPRTEVPSLLHLAEVLVQPGRPNRFNDYRFPSKLPEFLVSGKPVILPHSNLGRFLENGVNCILLDKGDPIEIAAKIERLFFEPELGARIGNAGRSFALARLDWSKNVNCIAAFYRQTLECPKFYPAGLAGEMSEPPVKLLAFYLPQYHPIPENDRWWGDGFTEWTNVSKARPVYDGHHQPQLPADLGFYDLRLNEVMEKQAVLARRFGIFGFCFYYYWFNGRRLLERPLEQMVKLGKPDFPFCVCWANENWTRSWDGSADEVLVQQQYSSDADERLIDDLVPLFRDPRYIRVLDAPLFLVYRASDLPDMAATIARWRARCADHGIPRVHIVMVQSFGNVDPRPAGFDAAVEFPPHLKRALVSPDLMPSVSPDFRGYMEDYLELAQNQVRQPLPPFVRYRGVMPSWDNSARRGNEAHIVIRSSPEIYQRLLAALVEQTMDARHVQEPLLFINAWNEWAEGTHLEPDQRHGKAWLEATFRGLTSGIANCLRNSGLPVTDRAIERALESSQLDVEPITSEQSEKMAKTENLVNPEDLERLLDRYGSTFLPVPLSYATVRDYCDSFDHIRSLASYNGDLKDVQRPWILKSILGHVPRGGRILEIGAGEPFVGDILGRLGYEVWVVDPYDGSGNGPVQFAQFSAECPAIRFIRDQFGDALLQPPERAFDCIYSISVLEHIDRDGLLAVARGLKKFLKPSGLSIHAIDHVHRGAGAAEHLAALELMTHCFGFSKSDLHSMLARMNDDVETYYLSAESHNRWRGGVPYSEFPMRTCVSVQMIAGARDIRDSAPTQP
jgi:glycosyltransferase involved in cell wall biosynthesis/2-polyprenyl-3-methyl-5-hydroxy-6-metoxy-1,4-benzoquinol methylase